MVKESYLFEAPGGQTTVKFVIWISRVKRNISGLVHTLSAQVVLPGITVLMWVAGNEY